MTSPHRRTSRAIWVVAGLALILTGCSVQAEVNRTVDSAELVEKVNTVLTEQVGRTPDEVTCPDALPVKKDAAVRCTLTDAGVSYGVSVTTLDVGDNFKIGVEVDNEPMPESAGS